MPDRKTPSLGISKAKPRAQTQPGAVAVPTDASGSGDGGELRDAESAEARRTRERSPIPGTVRVPIDPGEDITGNYEGEMLAEMRANSRTLPERVALLEVKSDGDRQEITNLRMLISDARLESAAARVRSDLVLDKVTGLQADFGVVKGTLAGQNLVLDKIAADAKRWADREHVTYTHQVEIDTAGELGELAVERAEKLATVDVTKARELDVIKAKRDRRRLIAAVAAGAGGLVEILHRLGIL